MKRNFIKRVGITASIAVPLLGLSSCSTEPNAAQMLLMAPAILPVAALHYSVPIKGPKRLYKSSVRGRWYQSREDIPDKPYIEFHSTRGMIRPSHDVGNPDGTVSRGSEIGTRSPGKEDFWEAYNNVHGYYRMASIEFYRHDRHEEEEERESWGFVKVSGKEMTGQKEVDGETVEFRLYSE